MEEEKTITIKKSDMWKYSTFLLLAVLVIGSVIIFTGDGSTTGSAVNDGTTNPPDTQDSVTRASIDDDAVLGSEDAPVTIVEFSDYQCPFCRKFWAETLPSIKSEYIETGKVKLVYRDFPLASLHPMAQPSAEAAECVREKGGDKAYYEYHDKMFEEQMVLDGGVVRSTVSYTSSDLKTWASELGYDISSCFDSGKYRNEVQKDLADGSNAGIQGTPGFIIMKSGEDEGTLLAGAYPFEAFKQAIEAELA